MNGFYGQDCETPCGACPCDITHGPCVGECAVGFYGEQCNKQCQASCVDNKCERLNGRCTSDCPTGFFGDFCSKNCSEGCQKLATETWESAPQSASRGFSVTRVEFNAMWTVKLDIVTDLVVTVSGIVEMGILVRNVPNYVNVLRMGVLIKVRNWQFRILY